MKKKINRSAVSCCKHTDSYKAEVISKDEQMKGMRVSGVPFFIIENQNGGRPTAFSGAQVGHRIVFIYYRVK